MSWGAPFACALGGGLLGLWGYLVAGPVAAAVSAGLGAMLGARVYEEFFEEDR